ncbi:MAG: CPBP family intramembrane glutamic endopeptidase [Flavitalea sp.]
MISSFSRISESNKVNVFSGNTSLPYNPTSYSVPVLFSYFLIRTFYLIFYEIFFRLTLIESISFFTGLYPAIIFSTILYGYLHLFSRKIEFYSSFFFGLILCWISWHTGSILPAIFIHLLLSLPYELRIILHQKTNSI